jgi:hypothetical protein
LRMKRSSMFFCTIELETLQAIMVTNMESASTTIGNFG